MKADGIYLFLIIISNTGFVPSFHVIIYFYLLYLFLLKQWSDGKFGYHVQEVNSTWLLRNWSASVLQLDPNTWVVEYRRSSILDKSRLFSALLEFLRLWLTSENTRMKQKFWLLSSLYTQFSYNSAEDRFEIPT